MPIRTAADIMTRSVVSLSAETDIYTAMQTLITKHFSGAPVVDSEGRLIGILSEKDCLKVMTAEAFDGLPEGKVGDYMTTAVQTVTPDTAVYDVVARFQSMPYRRLPVVDEHHHVVGQISRRDVLVGITKMRENSYLYGSQEIAVEPPAEGMGVDTAMRIARGR